ncbi:MAG: uroporphyrin-3 C-methyltransferase [Bermanella sp.]
MSEQKNKSKAVTDSSNVLLPDEPLKSTSLKSSKNVVAIISLAMVMVASVFFIYRIEMLALENNSLEKHLAIVAEQSSKQIQQNGQFIEQLEQSKQRLNAMTGRLAFMQQTLNQIPGARLDDWKLAEVEYLLRLANQRVMLQKEITGASALFDAADKVLASLDDPAMIMVREKMAEEMLMLGKATTIDQQGIYTKLQALKTIVHETVQPPKTFTSDSISDNTIQIKEPAATGFVDQLLSLISVRTRDKAFDAPLANQQYQLLEHSLTLMLEQAQWALLKSDQALYESSLDNAKNWIQNTLRHQQANALLNQIISLKLVKISSSMPDVSESLRLLRQIIKDRTYAPTTKSKDIEPTTVKDQPATQIENNDNKTSIIKREQA